MYVIGFTMSSDTPVWPGLLGRARPSTAAADRSTTWSGDETSPLIVYISIYLSIYLYIYISILCIVYIYISI